MAQVLKPRLHRGWWMRVAGDWLLSSVVVGFAYCSAWLLRFEFVIPTEEIAGLRTGLAIAVLLKSVIFCAMRLHLSRWSRYAGFSDLVKIACANVIASIASSTVWFAVIGPEFPRSVYVLDLLTCLTALGGVNFAARLLHEMSTSRKLDVSAKGLLIYGAGVAGIELAREIRANPSLGYRLIGFVDDDRRKHGVRLLGLPVIGSGDEIPELVERYRNRRTPVDEIVVSMPSATGRQLRAAVEKGCAAGIASRIVPGLGELISGKLAASNLREVSVTDLLGREPVNLNMDPIRRELMGRSILVTGAAGSIGSELCHQIAQLAPGRLVALDQAESELFRLENEIRSRYPDLALTAEIADIRDPRRVEEVIETYGIEAIFHAAAYKHVPVMERQACEAVRNNVIGTWNIAQAAWRMKVPRCLLISSDKAVNPSSIMGLTKRIGELIFSAERPNCGQIPETRFMAVRFGNVLVSNGSVVPIFRKQIAAGGPVTVTHPEMRRYFMTVQEAVQLVLQASTMSSGSEVYVLDMGKPVHIVQMARKMITLAGLVPDEDIEIRFVGLRPGEKLYEDLSLEAEHLAPTDHSKIRIFRGPRISFEELVPWMMELRNLLWRGDKEAVVQHMAKLVPEYRTMQPSDTTVGEHPRGLPVRALASAAAS